MTNLSEKIPCAIDDDQKTYIFTDKL